MWAVCPPIPHMQRHCAVCPGCSCTQEVYPMLSWWDFVGGVFSMWKAGEESDTSKFLQMGLSYENITDAHLGIVKM